MTYTEAKGWADFAFKLGLPFTKKHLFETCRNLSWEAAWDLFIASNPLYSAAAKANHVYGPDGVRVYLEQVSYARMRNTYPSKSRGRSILGPRIIPIENLIEDGVINEDYPNKHTL